MYAAAVAVPPRHVFRDQDVARHGGCLHETVSRRIAGGGLVGMISSFHGPTQERCVVRELFHDGGETIRRKQILE